MPGTDLDALVSQIADDEVAQLAARETQRLSERFEPHVDRCTNKEFIVDIPSDPVDLGLQQFNQRLATIRTNSNLVADWLKLAIHEVSRARQRRDNAKNAFDDKLNRTLTNDPDIRDLEGGQQAKLAAAKDKLARDARILQYCEQLYALARSYHDVFKLTLDTLKETKADLMAQLAVVKQQIALGEVGPTVLGGVAVSDTAPRHRSVEIEVAAALDGAAEGHLTL